MLPARLLAGFTWHAKNCSACGQKFMTFNARDARCVECVKHKRHASDAVHLWLDEVLANPDDQE